MSGCNFEQLGEQTGKTLPTWGLFYLYPMELNEKLYTYVLKSLSSGKTYIGQTHNLENRIKVHNEGKSPYTKGRGPWVLIYFEEFNTRAEAMEREKEENF